MLLQICLLALFSTQVFSQSNYFVGYFNKLVKWPYPIGICSATGLASGYVWYQCIWNGNAVNATSFKDSSCTTPSGTSTIYTPADMMYDGVHDFYCNGTNDYTEIELFLTSCSGTSLITYSAVNTCYAYARTNTTFDVFQESQCTSTESTLSVYATEFDSCDSYYGLAYTNVSYVATTSCTFYATQFGSAVYAKMLDCVYNDYSQLPVTKTNSNQFVGLSETVVQYVDFYTSIYPTSIYYDPDLCSKPWLVLMDFLFNGSAITLTEACNAYTGYGYTGYDYFAGVDLWVHVDIYESAVTSNRTTFLGCYLFAYEFEIIIQELTHNNASVTYFNCSSFNSTTTTAAPTKATTATTSMTTASATTASISFVIVATLATILMYIL